MILDILSHTPTWVFAVFVLLLAFGIRQSRDRVVSRGQLMIVPCAMAIWSVSLMLQSFGALALLTWAAAYVACIALGLARKPRSDVQYSPATRSFSVPGSWLPLALMMTIFLTRYAIAVLVAIHPTLRSTTSFAIAVGVLSGIIAGTFAARALRIGRAARTSDAIGSVAASLP